MSAIGDTREWFRRCLAAATPAEESAEAYTTVGQLPLAEFQGRAAERGLAIARAYGGVVLADAVGLGKTRVGLAIAQGLLRDRRLGGASAGPLWVCAPARLRRQWAEAVARAGIHDCDIITHTRLSRQFDAADLARPPAVVLVDEAHRFRNPRAKRSTALASLSARAPVVLATATPVCNSVWDLYHLLAFFLAEHDLRGAVGHNLREAFELAERGAFDLTELVEYVVIRRTEPPSKAGFGRRPNVGLEVLSYQARGAERWLWRHLEAELDQMAMELFRLDWPRPLLVEYLLKRWESGAEALAATLSEMVAFHHRWLEAEAHGRSLTRQSFRRLFGSEMERRQAVFPFLFDGPGREASHRRELVLADLAALEQLQERARAVADDGDGKRRAILELLRRRKRKVLVFTGYQQAARGLYDAIVEGLGARAKIGLVTGDGARATGLGRSSADEVVRRFAPQSNGVGDLAEHQQIDVLVSTDCLAEGVNLQDCGEVVLADLPYSPLAVEQRIGRLVRPGGPHERVTVYLPRPKEWADSLGLRRRLDRKLADASASGAAFVTAGHVGRRSEVQAASPNGPLAALTRMDALVAALDAGNAPHISPGFWRAATRRAPRRLWVRVAAREAQQTRWLWCLVREDAGAQMRLHALLDTMVGDADSRETVEPARPSVQLLAAAREAVAQRESLLRAARLAPFPLRLDAPQRRVWRRLCDCVERKALRVNKEELAGLRDDLLRSFPTGTERRFEELVDAELPPARLLERVRALVAGTPRWSPELRLEIVAGLELLPDQGGPMAKSG